LNLDQYVWSRNPRGLHMKNGGHIDDGGAFLSSLKLGWFKIVSGESDFGRSAEACLKNNITPIVRIYRSRPGVMPLDDAMLKSIREYFAIGVRWFEHLNEPNLEFEWPDGTPINPNRMDLIAPMMDNWLLFAEMIIGMGGYPGFPALTEAATPNNSAPLWMDSMLGYLRDVHTSRFINIANNGLWCATHPSPLNHFYQELPGGGPLSVRRPEQQDGNASGWHFEYPFDPISQQMDPGRSVAGGTPQTPYGDPSGIIAMGTHFHDRISQWFGLGTIPVVGTEGGIFVPFDAPFYQQDTRYPPYTIDSHAQAVLGMYNWIADVSPPWMFGICSWKQDEYEQYAGKTLDTLRQNNARLRTVPPLASGVPLVQPVAFVAPPRGPGPIHGTPDYHLFLFAPEINTEVFFNHAQNYWIVFRPVVANTLDFIGFFTPANSLAVTVVTTAASAPAFEQTIKTQYPNVLYDLILVEDPTTLGVILDDRVQRNTRFG
jgi:hypothetical protein